MKDKYGYSRIGYTDFLLDYTKKDHHNNLLRWIVDLTNCQKYLEIGVEKGENIHLVRDYVKKCVGVDIVDQFDDKRGIDFYKMTSDDFFYQNKEKFDIIFIDGDHSIEQVIKDFENALRILNPLGIILMHDTDPISWHLTHVNYSNDTYKIVRYINDNHKELNMITLPIHEAGLTIIMRKNERRADPNWEQHWSKNKQ